jgi:hypothetical protein
LAANGVNYLLDQIGEQCFDTCISQNFKIKLTFCYLSEMNCKLEHVALLQFSSLCELGEKQTFQTKLFNTRVRARGPAPVLLALRTR